MKLGKSNAFAATYSQLTNQKEKFQLEYAHTDSYSKGVSQLEMCDSSKLLIHTHAQARAVRCVCYHYTGLTIRCSACLSHSTTNSNAFSTEIHRLYLTHSCSDFVRSKCVKHHSKREIITKKQIY